MMPSEGGLNSGGREDGDGADAVGSWVGEECQFERVAQAVEGRVLWRAKDAAGEEVGMLEQTGAYAHTRWLWWADGAFSRWSGLSADRQHLLFCALPLAAAYRLDTLDGFRALIPTPARAALGEAFAAAIGDVGFAANLRHSWRVYVSAHAHWQHAALRPLLDCMRGDA